MNAHGACIVKDNGVYYLFGEWKSDNSNAFPGFSCYSSTDLVNWKSNKNSDILEVKFSGRSVAIVGESNPHGGYALVTILDKGNRVVYSSLVDFYSKYPENAVRIKTPTLPFAKYKLQVKVTGDKPEWSDKRKIMYGSDDTFVTINDIYYFR